MKKIIILTIVLLFSCTPMKNKNIYKRKMPNKNSDIYMIFSDETKCYRFTIENNSECFLNIYNYTEKERLKYMDKIIKKVSKHYTDNLPCYLDVFSYILNDNLTITIFNPNNDKYQYKVINDTIISNDNHKYIKISGS